MEVWNPADGAFVRMLTYDLPIANGGYQSAMISVNNNCDLIYYEGTPYFKRVWRYSVISNQWICIGEMSVDRGGLVALPVSGLTC